MPRLALRCTLAGAAAAACFACSSPGGGAGRTDGGDDTEASSGGSDDVTFSCTQAGQFICTEVLAPASQMAAEQEACVGEPGTFGAGCSRSGAFGCCAQGGDTQCYYSVAEAMIAKSICTGVGMTWSMPDEQ
jgi:hypothetical protein